MTVVALVAADISLIIPQNCETIDVVVTAAVTKGQAAYQLSTGKFGVADANGSGTQQFRGIYLKAAAAGGASTILKRGHCYGFTVSGLSGDDPLYLSDTAGALDTAAGTMTVVCGRVTAMTDAGVLTKVVYIEADWSRIWS